MSNIIQMASLDSFKGFSHPSVHVLFFFFLLENRISLFSGFHGLSMIKLVFTTLLCHQRWGKVPWHWWWWFKVTIVSNTTSVQVDLRLCQSLARVLTIILFKGYNSPIHEQFWLLDYKQAWSEKCQTQSIGRLVNR